MATQSLISDRASSHKFLYETLLLQIKEPLKLAFESLTEAKKQMRSLPTDFGKASASRQLTLHACFESLAQYKKETGGRLPRPGHATDAEAFVKLVKKSPLISKVKEFQSLKKTPFLDEKVIEIFSRTCQGSLGPICSFIGGTAAQVTFTFCVATVKHQYPCLSLDLSTGGPQSLYWDLCTLEPISLLRCCRGFTYGTA